MVRDRQGAYKAREEAGRLAVEAERANRTACAFLATMSDETRTPMDGALERTEILLDRSSARRRCGSRRARSGTHARRTTAAALLRDSPSRILRRGTLR